MLDRAEKAQTRESRDGALSPPLAEDSVSADNGEEPSNLEGVLDRLIEAAKRDHNGIISVGDVQDMIGRRSFGPMLLVPGLIGLSPIGAIPGIPGVMAAIELFFAWQIVIGRKNIWLPQFLTRRSMTTARFRRGVQALRPYARWVVTFLFGLVLDCARARHNPGLHLRLAEFRHGRSRTQIFDARVCA